MEINEIKLSHCPFCDSTNYSRDSLEPMDDFISCECECECGEWFKEYFGLDEVKFNTVKGEFVLNKALLKEDKEILIKAIDLLDDVDPESRARILKILNDELVEE